MTEAALTISHLSIQDRNGTALVDDVSLSIPRGGVFTLIGETGSGKSLIAQAVFGLLPSGLSVKGEIKVGGHEPIPASEPKRLAALWREQIMLIPQEPSTALDPTMRVRRQLALAGLDQGAIKPALAAFDLPVSTGEA
jgi:peptide/nickel transport system ATP-binding protein